MKNTEPILTSAAPPMDVTMRASASHASSRRRILFVTQSPQYGGAERHLVGLVQAVQPSEAQISIACLDRDNYTTHLANGGRHDVEIIRRTVDTGWDWFRLFRDVRPDVAVFIKSWMWCFPWYACLAARVAGVPRRVAIAHWPPSPPEPSSGDALRSRIERVRYRLNHQRVGYFCDTTICVSNAIRTALVEDCGFKQSRTVCVYNGVDVHEFAPEVEGLDGRSVAGGDLGDEFRIVCAARLSEEKRIDLLLDAVDRVVRNGINCRCVIVGDGPLRRELMEHSQALRISERVSFCGFQRDIRPYLLSADAFVLPSDIEGMPLSILEAMACGLPCIATGVGGNPEVITDGVDGLIVPRGSAEAVADAISQLARNPTRRQEMATLARAKVTSAFDSRRTISELRDILLN